MKLDFDQMMDYVGQYEFVKEDDGKERAEDDCICATLTSMLDLVRFEAE